MGNELDLAAFRKGAEAVGAIGRPLDLEGMDLSGSRIDTATRLGKANLKRAILRNVWWSKVDLSQADLSDAVMDGAHLDGANLDYAVVDNASLADADLSSASLRGASLRQAKLFNTNLNSTILDESDLQGATLKRADIRSASFELVLVDGVTLIDRTCTHDGNTNFSGVALESIRMPPELKSLFQYYVRKRHWNDWYSGSSVIKYPVRMFWYLSNYGSSMSRLIRWAFGSILVFTVLYALPSWIGFAPALRSTEEVNQRDVQSNGSNEQTGSSLTFWESAGRGIYFSAGAMTTSALGDFVPVGLYARTIVVIQSFWGYFLLGAIITRLAILFQAVEH